MLYIFFLTNNLHNFGSISLILQSRLDECKRPACKMSNVDDLFGCFEEEQNPVSESPEIFESEKPIEPEEKDESASLPPSDEYVFVI